MAHYNFTHDLADSHAGVVYVATILTNVYNIENITYNNTASHDITGEYRGRPFSVEVKEDLRHTKTGNIAIELKSRGKLSGLSTSLADYWCYKLGDQCYMIPTFILRQNVTGTKYRKVYGGDNKTSELLLVPVEEFKSWCTSLQQ